MTNRPVSPIWNKPDIAEKVGHVVADYAFLEYKMLIIFALITPQSVNDAFLAFYSVRSVNKREEIIMAAANRFLIPELRPALKRLCRRFRGAAKRRTEVAHCVFMSGSKGVYRLKTVSGAPVFEEMTDDFFKRTSDQFGNLSEDLHVFSTFAAGSLERMMHILRQLPFPPDTPPPEFGKPRGAEGQREKAQRKESLRRLKLEHMIRPPHDSDAQSCG